MSIRVMTRVWEHSRATGGELLVMLALADYSNNDDGDSYPSIPKLAAKARLTERQVRRVLNKLEQSGEIRRQRSNGGRNRRNHYLITITENPDNITLTELQGKNNTVIHDSETLTPVSGALNRHRTVNKKESAKAPVSLSPIKRSGIRSAAPGELAPSPAFDAWWKVYPRSEGKLDALKAWRRAAFSPELVEKIMAQTKRYAVAKIGTEKQFIKTPAAWLNGRRWEDDLEDVVIAGGQDDPEWRQRTFSNV